MKNSSSNFFYMLYSFNFYIENYDSFWVSFLNKMGSLGQVPLFFIEMLDCSSNVCWNYYYISIEMLLQLCQRSVVYISVGYISVLFIFVSLLLPIVLFLGYCSFMVSYKIGYCDSSSFIVLFQKWFILVPLPFCVKFRISLFL